MARPTAVLFQVKYTNRMFRGLTRSRSGKCMTSDQGCACQGAEGGCGAAQRGAAWACPSLDRIKREKGVWWMPWQQEAMKDVIPCDKLWGAGNGL
jgi:hypothetical protein